MIPFLKLFGVEEGNGISPFAVEIQSPAHLGCLIEEFFKPSRKDPRGEQHMVEEVHDPEVEASRRRRTPSTYIAAPHVIATHMQDIRLELEDNEVGSSNIVDKEFIAGEEEAGTDDKEGGNLPSDGTTLFENGDSSKSYMQYKQLMLC